MSCCIGLGKLSSLYLYIVYSIIFKCLKDFILTFESIKYGEERGLFWISSELNNHILIKSLYKYISFIIFGIIFLYFTTIKKKEKEKNVTTKFLYNKIDKISNSTKFWFFIMCLIYVFFLELIEISYSIGFHNCDLWIFNIAFTLMFISYYYSVKHYKHQIYSLSFIFFNNLIILIIKSFFPIDNNVYKTTEDLFKYKLVSIGIFIIFIINSFLISFSRVLGKVLMELKFISPYLIIIFIGIIGCIFTSIFLLISNNYQCKGVTLDNICNVYDINYNKNETLVYFDSIEKYYNNLKYNLNNKTTKFYIEILIVTPLNLFINFMVFNYEILLIYYLNPIYILISDSLYYGTKSLIYYMINSKENDLVTFILNEICDFIAILGYLIYLEIIELKFCELNKNVRKRISERAFLDAINVETINLEEEEEKHDNSNISDNKDNNNNIK